jgi:alkaline phosphatase D
MAIVPEMLTRRSFLLTAGAGALATSSALAVPYYARRHGSPAFSHGVQSGDVDCSSGVVWARTDRPAEVMLEYSTTDSFTNAARMPVQKALGTSDNTVKTMLQGLLPDQDIFYRFTASDPYSSHLVSEPIIGRFRTAPTSRRSVRFAWSGDTAGQGWGIDEVGMKTYASIARHTPDFFLHSGDTIYADGAMKDEVDLKDGTKWKNVVLIDEKRKVAETLDEYRGQWKYNLLDKNLLAMNAALPTFFQWDDHEVVNNWSSSKDLTADDRYKEKSIAVLAARAGRAFHEMTPIRFTPAEPGRVYRKIAYGPLVDVFFLDMRSYRGATARTCRPNSLRECTPARLSGRPTGCGASLRPIRKATWKVIACRHAARPRGLGRCRQQALATEGDRQRRLNGPAGGARAGNRRPAALSCKNDNGIHNVGLADGGRALYRRPPLQIRIAGAVPGVRAVLGIRLRTDPFSGTYRPQPTSTCTFRPGSPLHQVVEGAERRTGAESAAFGRLAIFRPR